MFKNLKSLFIENVDDGSKKEKIEEPKPVEKNTKNKKVTQPVAKAAFQASPGKVSSKFMEILFKAMEDNNLDGFDYLEFKQSLKSLEKMPMDEQTRFKSAFAMA